MGLKAEEPMGQEAPSGSEPSASVPGTGRGEGYRDAKVPLPPEHLLFQPGCPAP